jgi:hypothetical protein
MSSQNEADAPGVFKTPLMSDIVPLSMTEEQFSLYIL